MPVAHLPTAKCLQILSNVPWGHKSPVGNHWIRRNGQINRECHTFNQWSQNKRFFSREKFSAQPGALSEARGRMRGLVISAKTIRNPSLARSLVSQADEVVHGSAHITKQEMHPAFESTPFKFISFQLNFFQISSCHLEVEWFCEKACSIRGADGSSYGPHQMLQSLIWLKGYN